MIVEEVGGAAGGEAQHEVACVDEEFLVSMQTFSGGIG